MPTIPPLISVIIPCYQQAHFLAEAIDSVLAQTHPRHEVIVVDDGSSDGAGEIVKRYPMVRYLRQDNLGVSSARNRGMAVCGGDYVVFLDADDRLLPNALEVGLEYFQAHPEAALVFGRCRLIGPDGSPSPGLQPPCAEAVDYGDFLGGNQIWHPAEAMVRRFVLEAGMVFDTGLANASDFAFYLDLARRWPIRSHNVLVSEYRQHSSNKTKDVPKTLWFGLRILQRQREYITSNPRYAGIYQDSIRNLKKTYCQKALAQLADYLRRGGNHQQAAQNAVMCLRHIPPLLPVILHEKLERWLGAYPEVRAFFVRAAGSPPRPPDEGRGGGV